ncbi:hypothetical protein FOZ61_011015, partial [Perkinsus olseni]
MPSNRDYDHLFKLVLIGDSGVGKSCLLLRFADDSFTDSYITTIGVDFRFRTIPVSDKTVKLQIWDTAGQERFRTITSAYYRGADGIMMVYDCTHRESFDNIDTWLSEVNRYANDSTVKILIGNKSDLKEDQQVTAEEGEQKAKALGFSGFILTSAKDASNVETAFSMVSQSLIDTRAAAAAAGQGGNRQQGGGIMQLRNAGSSASGYYPSNCCGHAAATASHHQQQSVTISPMPHHRDFPPAYPHVGVPVSSADHPLDINDLALSGEDPRSTIVDAAREAYHAKETALSLARHSDNNLISRLAEAVANSAKGCVHEARG